MSQRDKIKWTVICAALTLLLYSIPYGHLLGYPLLLLSTVAHEMGHGVAAMLLGGNFKEFTMSLNGSGYATYEITPGRLKQALIAAGGLLGPACVAALGFFAAKRENWSRLLLFLFGAVLALSCVLVVRGTFALAFVGLVAFFLLGSARLLPEGWATPTVVFLSLQLGLSVFSRADYLFARSAPSGPSDVAQMAQALWLPFWVWGLVCGAFSLLILGLGVYLYARPED